MELASKLPTHARTHEQRISLLQTLKGSLRYLVKEIEKEEQRRDQEEREKKMDEHRKKCIPAMMAFLWKSPSPW